MLKVVLVQFLTIYGKFFTLCPGNSYPAEEAPGEILLFKISLHFDMLWCSGRKLCVLSDFSFTVFQ